MMGLFFITGNATKFLTAKNVLAKYGVELEQQTIDVPEIQAIGGQEICEYSAQYAYARIKQPLVVTDVSYHIRALNGFPGPYIKHINHWLKPEHLLALLAQEQDRTVEIKEFLTYIDDKGMKTFSTTQQAKIATKVYDDTQGFTIDKILIREGYAQPQNTIPKEELQKFFEQNVYVWHNLGVYLNARK